MKETVDDDEYHYKQENKYLLIHTLILLHLPAQYKGTALQTSVTATILLIHFLF